MLAHIAPAFTFLLIAEAVDRGAEVTQDVLAACAAGNKIYAQRVEHPPRACRASFVDGAQEPARFTRLHFNFQHGASVGGRNDALRNAIDDTSNSRADDISGLMRSYRTPLVPIIRDPGGVRR